MPQLEGRKIKKAQIIEDIGVGVILIQEEQEDNEQKEEQSTNTD